LINYFVASKGEGDEEEEKIFKSTKGRREARRGGAGISCHGLESGKCALVY
jgi:hypothetical protein